tara:strand:+ start:282 stop:491 length:210 start_codon:yes stop_codon:yes gene_type:complete
MSTLTAANTAGAFEGLASDKRAEAILHFVLPRAISTPKEKAAPGGKGKASAERADKADEAQSLQLVPLE